jgi:opacity protein-like surface antigen
MKRLIVVAVLVVLASAVAFSQAIPQWEVFGGYSYLRVNPGFGADGVNTSGWEAAANYNFNKTWGLKADFSGHYCCDSNHMHNFLFGPQFSYRRDKYTLFAHGLIGGSHASALGASDSSVAWALGGGWDWNATDSVAVRIFQADYLGTHFLGDTQHNFRVSTGLVFRFGKQ